MVERPTDPSWRASPGRIDFAVDGDDASAEFHLSREVVTQRSDRSRHARWHLEMVDAHITPADDLAVANCPVESPQICGIRPCTGVRDHGAVGLGVGCNVGGVEHFGGVLVRYEVCGIGQVSEVSGDIGSVDAVDREVRREVIRLVFPVLEIALAIGSDAAVSIALEHYGLLLEVQ